MNTYISIGAQCTTPVLFNKLQVKKETLPFDWMFSTPEFVYTILKLLLVDKKEIEDIIDNDFFLCDKKASVTTIENFITNEDGPVMVNLKYNVCFPHDDLLNRDKYIRRLERLKQVILDKDIFINFIYVSVSSNTVGNYTIDGVEPIQELYEYIEKINSIIKDIRINYKILIFDTNKPSDIKPSDDLHMVYYDIENKNGWGALLPELIEKCNNLLNTGVMFK